MAADTQFPGVTVGNAETDQFQGWFIGQFVDADGGLRSRQDIEVKWGVHPAGETRPKGWSLTRSATTISILIEGAVVTRFRGPGWQREVKLEHKGDYVIFEPGVEHTWHNDVDALVLTIRTPSVEDDQENFIS